MMRAGTQRGQSLIIAAVAIGAIAGMFVLTINVGLLMLDRATLNTAAQNAGLAAVRLGSAGDVAIDPDWAEARVAEVLTAELQNLRSAAQSPDEIIARAQVEVINPDGTGHACVDGACYQGPVVRVTLTDAQICPPVAGCVAVSTVRTVARETTVVSPASATPVPGQVILLP
jgi:hypothetical protein